tara:strand:+ start:6739 stop:6864 length:126 start_codon:yes stop_codon:yes gene_type:complete
VRSDRPPVSLVFTVFMACGKNETAVKKAAKYPKIIKFIMAF